MKQKLDFFNLLALVLSQQSESGSTKKFTKWIERYVKENIEGASAYINNGNLYVTTGIVDVYPCIVSHTDTVHAVNNNVSLHRSGEILFAFDDKTGRQYGIGGDDKVGVFICLWMLHQLPAVKCAFFRDEEIGCKGSKLADNKFFDDCAFILQCDRRGNTDFVSEIGGMQLYGNDFRKAIAPTLKKFGYSETDGMMTDVERLKMNGIPLCMANMSCGYYSPHTNNEYVRIDDVKDCADMVQELCELHGYEQWVHKYEPPKWEKNWKYEGGAWKKIHDSYGYTSEWEDYYNGETTKTPWWEQPEKIPAHQWWKSAEVRYEKDAKWWYVPSKVQGQMMVVGTGTFANPFRESKPEYDKLIPVLYPSKPAEKNADAITPVSECPLCAKSGDMRYDDQAHDYFCFNCGEYSKDAQDLMRFKENMIKEEEDKRSNLEVNS